MANPFLNKDCHDVETALLLEKALVTDIGNAVAYTDGDRIFINTDDNLFNILPAYDHKMLKWLLWHEKMHLELRHHNRFFKYLYELEEAELMDEFAITKEEVNIIMDVLVHDSLCKMFPELVETALNNLAQMRNRNSLEYTFKTHTLEEMLEEYRKHKGPPEDEEDDKKGPTGGTGKPKDDDKKTGDGPEEPKTDKSKPKEKPGKSGSPKDEPKEHEAGGSPEHGSKERPEDGAPKLDEERPEPEEEHKKTDWSKLDDIDVKEFIEKDEGDRYVEQINRLKRKKFKLGKLTETLNGLATTNRRRSYAMPSSIRVNKDVILKGRVPGKTKLYLCFDASGSMGRELETFKEIISKSIPQALDVPCRWFTYEYGEGKFRDILGVYADSGFSDDGDRLIKLCWEAEQQGYSPIGVTDGGGCISWSKDMLKELKRTVLVGQNREWLEAAQRINPRVQILDI